MSEKYANILANMEYKTAFNGKTITVNMLEGIQGSVASGKFISADEVIAYATAGSGTKGLLITHEVSLAWKEATNG